MKGSNSRFVLALALTSVLPACLLEESDDPVSQTEQNLKGWNRLAANRLAANRLAANRLAANRLAANSLSSYLIPLSDTSDILGTTEGREVYSYLVSCALADGVVIHADVPGAADTPSDSSYLCSGGHCEFYGSLDLAPSWLDRKLNNQGKGWVSACVLSRCNANDTAEAISLRGRASGLVVGAEEAALYSVEEGAFYGNVFNDDPDPAAPPEWYACRGEGQASGEFGGLINRDCAEPDPADPTHTLCGFNYAGDCRDFTPDLPSPYACRGFNGGYYEDCHEESGNSAGHWPGGNQAFHQTITTYVTN